jgi:hypothetical protein
MTNTDGIIKSLQTLIKHEKELQSQESEIIELKNLLARALDTITFHEQKLNILMGTNVIISQELDKLRNQKYSFGLN